jgi:hypothetical protein
VLPFLGSGGGSEREIAVELFERPEAAIVRKLTGRSDAEFGGVEGGGDEEPEGEGTEGMHGREGE